MRFYNQTHRYYCGVDLHARSMFVHVLDQQGQTAFLGIPLTRHRRGATIAPALGEPALCPFPRTVACCTAPTSLRPFVVATGPRASPVTATWS